MIYNIKLVTLIRIDQTYTYSLIQWIHWFLWNVFPPIHSSKHLHHPPPKERFVKPSEWGHYREYGRCQSRGLVTGSTPIFICLWLDLSLWFALSVRFWPTLILTSIRSLGVVLSADHKQSHWRVVIYSTLFLLPHREL